MNLYCRTLFKGNASIGSQFLEACAKEDKAICIIHNSQKMTIKPEDFNKFFTMSNKKYEQKHGNGFYTLHYIQFKPDGGKNHDMER